MSGTILSTNTMVSRMRPRLLETQLRSLLYLGGGGGEEAISYVYTKRIAYVRNDQHVCKTIVYEMIDIHTKYFYMNTKRLIFIRNDL